MESVTFGSKLKELRTRKGEGQKELGDLLGVGAPQIRRYESDDVLPDHEKVKILCKHYGYDFVSLIYPREKPEPEKSESGGGDDYKAKYIKLLEDENKQKGTIITVSLTAMQVAQQSILANIEAGFDWLIDREAGGNRKQAVQMRKELDKRIGDKFGVSQRKDIRAGR